MNLKDNTLEQPRKGLVHFDEYRAPSIPTLVGIARYWRWLKQSLRSTKRDKSFITDNRLSEVANDLLDKFAAPPSFADLLKKLDEELLHEGKMREGVHLLVIPACENENILEIWAEKHSFTHLLPPSRQQISSSYQTSQSILPGSDALVIPELDRWFLRHQNGLSNVRKLLEEISTAKGPIVVGCNSWAWEFLNKAVGAHHLLPNPKTFPSFSGHDLKEWFTHLAQENKTNHHNFRLAIDNTSVFSNIEKADQGSSYFERLAGESRGVCWIAWHLWRKSIRLRDDGENPDAANNSLQHDTVWISPLSDIHFPADHKETSLLIIHALLIHGRLSKAELKLVTPSISSAGVIPALVRAGIVLDIDGNLSCSPAAYPQIRVLLEDAGFTMDGF